MPDLEIIHEVHVCWVRDCDETATGWWNANIYGHHSLPARMVPVCDRHNPWQARLQRVRAKHERTGGPDEQELADWGFSS
jgi:hypothetical protein